MAKRNLLLEYSEELAVKIDNYITKVYGESFKLNAEDLEDDEDYYEDPVNWSKDEDGREARKDRTFATLEGMELRWSSTN